MARRSRPGSNGESYSECNNHRSEGASAIVTISPNPTSNGIVQVNAFNDVIQQIQIYSLDGKLVDTIRPATTLAQVRLPLIMGTYLIDVKTARGRKVERVVRR